MENFTFCAVKGTQDLGRAAKFTMSERFEIGSGINFIIQGVFQRSESVCFSQIILNFQGKSLFFGYCLPKMQDSQFIPHSKFGYIRPLSANFTIWSNTLKQFIGKLPTNCLFLFDHFVGLALKGLQSSLAFPIGLKKIRKNRLSFSNRNNVFQDTFSKNIAWEGVMRSN